MYAFSIFLKLYAPDEHTLQFPVNAGDEFIVSTEDEYSEKSDNKVLYMHYVRSYIPNFSTLKLMRIDPEKPAEGHRTWQTHLRR